MHARCRDCIEEHAEKPVDNNILQQSSHPTPSWLLKEGNSSTVSLRGPATTGRSSSIGNRWRCNPAPAGDSAMRRRRWKPGPEGLQVSSGTRRMTIQSLPDCSGMASHHFSSRVLDNPLSDKVGHGIERRSGLHLNSLAFKVVNKTGQLCRSPQIRDAAPVLLLEGGRDDSVGS